MDTLDIKMCQTLNPATLLPVVGSRGLLHHCIEIIEQTYSSRSDLLHEPLDSPEVKWFTDGNSVIEMGTRKAGYAIVGLDEVRETKALPPQTSAQNAELTALTRALQEFSGGLVVRIPGFHCCGPGSISGRGTEIPHSQR